MCALASSWRCEDIHSVRSLRQKCCDLHDFSNHSAIHSSAPSQHYCTALVASPYPRAESRIQQVAFLVLSENLHLFRVVALGDECKARHLPKLSRISKHAHVHEFDHIALCILVDALTERCTKVRRLFLNDRPLFCSCFCPPHLRDERAACTEQSHFALTQTSIRAPTKIQCYWLP
jgi:hypothetical protein